jgi:hypothetical protein
MFLALLVGCLACRHFVAGCLFWLSCWLVRCSVGSFVGGLFGRLVDWLCGSSVSWLFRPGKEGQQGLHHYVIVLSVAPYFGSLG